MAKKAFTFYISLLTVICVALSITAYQFAKKENGEQPEASPQLLKEKPSKEKEIVYNDPSTKNVQEFSSFASKPIEKPKKSEPKLVVAEQLKIQTQSQSVDSQTLSVEKTPDRFEMDPKKSSVKISANPSLPDKRSLEVTSTDKIANSRQDLTYPKQYEGPIRETISNPMHEPSYKVVSEEKMCVAPVQPCSAKFICRALSECYNSPPCQAPCGISYQTLSCNAWEFPHRVYVDHVEGRWLDNHEGYTSLGIFYAVDTLAFCNHFVPFVDLRYHIFNDGKKAGNFGGGVRYINDARRFALGVNAYYDFRQNLWHHTYHDIGVGLEFLNPRIDVRLNGYIPVGKQNGFSSKQVFDSYIGDYKASLRKKRSSLWGVDGEVGHWLKRKSPCDFFDLYGALGGYYFSSRDHQNKDLYGIDARLFTNLGSFFVFELRGGYDRVYHGMVQGCLTVSLPLDLFFYGLGYLTGRCGPVSYGCCQTRPDSCCGEFLDPVQRQEIMVLSKKSCCWNWNWDSEGCNCKR